MKNRYFLIAILCICSCATSFAQNANTLYFMDEISTRNFMNPAFLPRCKSYFDFIFLPNVSAEIGENAFTIKDMIYQQDGKTYNFLSNQNTLLNFINKIPQTPYAKASARVNILNFGAQLNPGHYLLFDMNLRADATAYIPNDAFRFLLNGSSSITSTNKYDFSTLNAFADVYATFGFGYAGRIAKHVTFGAKAKFLLGLAHIQSQIDELSLSTSKNQWEMVSDASVYAFSPVKMTFVRGSDGKFSNVQFGSIKPAGYGVSFDIGLTYEPIPYLTLSAAVVDLGFISWNGYSYKGQLNGTYTYTGMGDINYGDSLKLNTKVFEEIGSKIEKEIKISDYNKSEWHMITARFNAGVEYGILKNKISFGVMNQLTFRNSYAYDEVTLAVNFRPGNVLKASLSYSFLNGHTSSIGAGINLNFGGFCWYVISDYIPMSYTQVTNSANTKNYILPDGIDHFNIQTGVVFNIHRFDRDLDKDGVVNNRDRCPDTDMELLRKQCPKMKTWEMIDINGCGFDDDQDGVNDCFDMCPGTPAGAPVDSFGCPRDLDKDGVPDYLDKCPNTPANVQVDANGCPLDEDGDSIPDYLDKCPGTPVGVVVDSLGCPVDSDGDSIPDYLDKCPDTPVGVVVDSLGCPMDEDKDGVPDYMDKCPGTPANVAVTAIGCPIDTDGDSVPDYLDKCPDRPGSASTDGCPELAELRSVFKQAVKGIQFEAGKAAIMSVSYPILDQIASFMSTDSTFSIEVNAHTDNGGDSLANVILTQRRADAIRQYIISKGVNSLRIRSTGYGSSQPVATNDNEVGRELNRRVEFNIVYVNKILTSEPEPMYQIEESAQPETIINEPEPQTKKAASRKSSKKKNKRK